MVQVLKPLSEQVSLPNNLAWADEGCSFGSIISSISKDVDDDSTYARAICAPILSAPPACIPPPFNSVVEPNFDSIMQIRMTAPTETPAERTEHKIIIRARYEFLHEDAENDLLDRLLVVFQELDNEVNVNYVWPSKALTTNFQDHEFGIPEIIAEQILDYSKLLVICTYQNSNKGNISTCEHDINNGQETWPPEVILSKAWISRIRIEVPDAPTTVRPPDAGTLHCGRFVTFNTRYLVDGHPNSSIFGSFGDLFQGFTSISSDEDAQPITISFRGPCKSMTITSYGHGSGAKMTALGFFGEFITEQFFAGGSPDTKTITSPNNRDDIYDVILDPGVGSTPFVVAYSDFEFVSNSPCPGPQTPTLGSANFSTWRKLLVSWVLNNGNDDFIRLWLCTNRRCILVFRKKLPTPQEIEVPVDLLEEDELSIGIQAEDDDGNVSEMSDLLPISLIAFISGADGSDPLTEPARDSYYLEDGDPASYTNEESGHSGTYTEESQ